MFFVVVNIAGLDLADEFGFAFVLGDAVDGEIIQRDSHRQADAVGLAHGFPLGLRRSWLGLDVNIARVDLVNVQMALPQLTRLPLEIKRADVYIGAGGNDAQLIGVDALQHAASERFGCDVHIGELGQLIHGKTQAAVGVEQPRRAAYACAQQNNHRAQRVFEQAAGFFGFLGSGGWRWRNGEVFCCLEIGGWFGHDIWGGNGVSGCLWGWSLATLNSVSGCRCGEQ